jgi:hypothetical protein
VLPWDVRVPRHDDGRVLVWVQPTRASVRPDEPSPAIPVPRRPAISTSTSPPVAPIEREPSERRDVDWRREKDLAVDAAVAGIVRNEGYRALGPRESTGLREEELPASPFEPPPQHKFGDTGENALGDTVVWHSKSCYTVLEPAFNTQGQHGVKRDGQFMCIMPVGKEEPRGDLFEHIRKRQEQRKQLPATGQSQQVQSSPEKSPSGEN